MQKRPEILGSLGFPSSEFVSNGNTSTGGTSPTFTTPTSQLANKGRTAAGWPGGVENDDGYDSAATVVEINGPRRKRGTLSISSDHESDYEVDNEKAFTTGGQFRATNSSDNHLEHEDGNCNIATTQTSFRELLNAHITPKLVRRLAYMTDTGVVFHNGFTPYPIVLPHHQTPKPGDYQTKTVAPTTAYATPGRSRRQESHTSQESPKPPRRTLRTSEIHKWEPRSEDSPLHGLGLTTKKSKSKLSAKPATPQKAEGSAGQNLDKLMEEFLKIAAKHTKEDVRNKILREDYATDRKDSRNVKENLLAYMGAKKRAAKTAPASTDMDGTMEGEPPTSSVQKTPRHDQYGKHSKPTEDGFGQVKTEKAQSKQLPASMPQKPRAKPSPVQKAGAKPPASGCKSKKTTTSCGVAEKVSKVQRICPEAKTDGVNGLKILLAPGFSGTTSKPKSVRKELSKVLTIKTLPRKAPSLVLIEHSSKISHKIESSLEAFSPKPTSVTSDNLRPQRTSKPLKPQKAISMATSKTQREVGPDYNTQRWSRLVIPPPSVSESWPNMPLERRIQTNEPKLWKFYYHYFFEFIIMLVVSIVFVWFTHG